MGRFGCGRCNTRLHLVSIWWQFGVGAVIALTHDVITTIGLFSLLQLEFNVSTVAAVLTIAGYSINDTVVVYDRVRENLRRYKRLSLIELFNRSINETLARTVMTSVTTLLALLALYFFGGEVTGLHDCVDLGRFCRHLFLYCFGGPAACVF